MSMPTGSITYACFNDRLMAGQFDPAAKCYCALVTARYRPNAKHTSYQDVARFEHPATGGYELGGQNVIVKATNYVMFLEIDFGGTWFESATITARYAVYYQPTAGLVFCNDLGKNITSTGGRWELEGSTLRLNTAAEFYRREALKREAELVELRGRPS
jgi:hypothetical protein